ncbi:MAG: crossover junction endodeoxyribonuclease RuvC [Candidatus Delongbacteria bacterium]|jgi:crossover junction endodeoxyribonuclease RuvC|nr:crossover junction endodeoxyribonuclease RuvC [Candidatus Delongbacteria bacterium]
MTRNKNENIILGIDPGTTIMGYAVIDCMNKKVKLISLGVIDLRGYNDHYLKIKHIFERTQSLIDQYHPDELAIEAPFYGKNVQSMLKLGRAQGAAISAALSRAMPIYEYAPKKIKVSITGNGNAKKQQVADMLQRLLGYENQPKSLDATDALGAAMCHHYQLQNPLSTGNATSWKNFIKNNPGKVKG